MPVLPIQIRFPDAQALGHELSQGLSKGLIEAQEAIVTARQAIFRREVDHTVPETIAVGMFIHRQQPDTHA